MITRMAGIELMFKISDVSADALIAATADNFGILYLEYIWAEQETARLAPKTHRASADTLHWATFYSLCSSDRRSWRNGGKPLAAAGVWVNAMEFLIACTKIGVLVHGTCNTSDTIYGRTNATTVFPSSET